MQVLSPVTESMDHLEASSCRRAQAYRYGHVGTNCSSRHDTAQAADARSHSLWLHGSKPTCCSSCTHKLTSVRSPSITPPGLVVMPSVCPPMLVEHWTRTDCFVCLGCLQGDFNLSNLQDGFLATAFLVGLLIASPIFSEACKHYSAFR